MFIRLALVASLFTIITNLAYGQAEPTKPKLKDNSAPVEWAKVLLEDLYTECTIGKTATACALLSESLKGASNKATVKNLHLDKLKGSAGFKIETTELSPNGSEIRILGALGSKTLPPEYPPIEIKFVARVSKQSDDNWRISFFSFTLPSK